MEIKRHVDQYQRFGEGVIFGRITTCSNVGNVKQFMHLNELHVVPFSVTKVVESVNSMHIIFFKPC